MYNTSLLTCGCGWTSGGSEGSERKDGSRLGSREGGEVELELRDDSGRSNENDSVCAGSTGGLRSYNDKEEGQEGERDESVVGG